MSDFKKTYPLGRSISVLFSNIGWGLAAIGLLLAIAGFALGATPGSGGATGEVSLTARIAASALGLGIIAFGLMSLLLAVQSRAAMDTADMTREMLMLARRRPERKALSRPQAGTADIERDTPDEPVAPIRQPGSGAVQDDALKAVPVDDVPPMPVHLKARLSAPTPTPTPAAAPRLSQPGPKSVSRTEPGFAAKPEGAARRAHPIFSAKPPR
ncbi:MAG: hypothetical protein WA873_08830 [Jannaschia helgolandensis]